MLVDEAIVSYQTVDGQKLDINIYNFYIESNGFLKLSETYHSDYSKIVYHEEIDFEIRGIVPIFDSDGVHHSLSYRPSNSVKILNTIQDVKMSNPYIKWNNLYGTLNDIEFQTGKAILQNKRISFNKFSIIFSITDNNSVINLNNVRLERDGFNFENVEIADPFFEINTLGYIQVTDVKVSGNDGITMEGILTVGGKTATALSTYSIKNPVLQHFLLTGDGIDGFTMDVPGTEIICYKGKVVVNKIRWEPGAYYDSFKLTLEDAKYVYEDDKGRVVSPLGDGLTMDEKGRLWIQVKDEKMDFGKWISKKYP